MENKLLFSYYGDDFTGSTDVMESLALNGVPTALFLDAPSEDEVDGFRFKNEALAGKEGKIKAFGVAGISRSLSPEKMDEELPPIFEKISQINSKFFHYKVCSTFDSSPTVGSIGHATDLAYEFFPSNYIPLLIGAPSLNRFSVFGNLFARVDNTTYRLDRHPTMSKHPATPMHEADLRLHLAKQTYRNTALMDIFALGLEEAERKKHFSSLHNEAGEYILFDILDESHLLKAGQLMVETASEQKQLLVGSSGMEYAICGYLQQKGILQKPEFSKSAGEKEAVIITTGSASPMTKTQIEWAAENGFEALRIDTLALANPEKREAEKARIIKVGLQAVEKSKSVVFYAALGPADPAIAQTKAFIEKLTDKKPVSEILAGAQGEIMKSLLEQTKIKRATVAGGDTSGYVARALGIYALETLVPIAPGAPLCIAHSHNSDFDGLEIALKGGQNGNAQYFGAIRAGKFIE